MRDEASMLRAALREMEHKTWARDLVARERIEEAGICCEECVYWDRRQTRGDCRKSAPAVYQEQSYARWPTTLPDDWCGEFLGSMRWASSYLTREYMDEVREQDRDQ